MRPYKNIVQGGRAADCRPTVVTIGVAGVAGVAGVGVAGVDVVGIDVDSSVAKGAVSLTQGVSGSVAAVTRRKLNGQNSNMNMTMVGRFGHRMCYGPF
jgi:hypothetical protein